MTEEVRDAIPALRTLSIQAMHSQLVSARTLPPRTLLYRATHRSLL